MSRLPIHNRKGKIVAHAIVDDADYARASQYPWSFRDGDKYPCYSIYIPIRRSKKIYLSNLILGHPSSRSIVVGYRDGNTLNCSRQNLIVRTSRERGALMKKQKRDTSSVYRGVSYDASRRKWVAEIRRDKKRVFSKRCDSEEEAALARDTAAIKIYGKGNCFLNFPQYIYMPSRLKTPIPLG